MRPLKLTVSAFGPYAGKVVMDLEKLGRDAKLFSDFPGRDFPSFDHTVDR